MSPARVLQQQIPLAGSILWAPPGANRPGDVAFPVFLRQSALQAIYEHLATLPPQGQGILGFMIGDRCECPVTGVEYSVIDAALRLNQTIYGDRSRDVVTRLWKRLEAQLEAQRAHLIGWYHTHAPLPLELSVHDVETHEAYFSEPWQVGMVVGTDPAAPAGAFFRTGEGDDWVRTPQPFYELLNEDSVRAGGKKRSFMTWKTYRAYNPPALQPRTTAPPPPQSKPPVPPPYVEPEQQQEPDGLEHMPQAELEEPARVQWDEPSRAAPPEEPEEPAKPTKKEEKVEDPHELKFLTTADDFAAGSLPPPPRPPPSASPAQRPRAPAPVDSEPLNWEEEPPFEQEHVLELPEDIAPPPPTPEPRAARRRASRVNWRKWIRITIRTGLMLFVIAAGWMAYERFGPTVRQRIKVAFAPRPARPKVKPPREIKPPRAAAPAVPAPPAAPAPRPVRIPPPSSPAFALLDQRSDSLARALQAYNGRARLFERRLLDCPSLGRGLVRVERALARYGVQRSAMRATLDPDRAARDREFLASIESVARQFQRARCEHP